MVITSGCTVKHSPNAASIGIEDSPQFSGKGTLSIVNVQTDKTVQDLGRAGFGTLQGDLYTWTEAAVKLLTTELEELGLTVQDDGEKTIQISVTNLLPSS